MKLNTILAGIGLGAGLVYFMDPRHGSRRRAKVRDRALRLVNSLDESMEIGVEDMRNRARGILSELTARLVDEESPDWILEERVRTALGRIARHTRSIDVRSSGGHIHLTGPVLRNERDLILKTVARTRGVYSVEDELQVFDNPGEIPSLQQTAMSQRRVQADMQRTWSPASRLISGVGGSLLTLYGLKRTGLTKPILSTAGLILTTRSVTNKDIPSLLGMGGENAIKVRKAIHVDAPIDEVYQFWRNFENFKLFMEHVKEISSQEDLSTWKVAGPAGTSVEFQAQITRDIPNQSIAWQTLPDSQVQHAGFVRFDPNPDGSTRVTVQMDYLPPAGELGHVIVQLFGVDPRQAMNEDLVRLKSLLEVGKTSSSSGTAVIRDADVESDIE